jgi:hypothetical protein
MKRGSIATVQTSVDRRQRALLSQIATQRAIIAEAEMRIAQLTCKLHEAAPAAYSRMLEQRAAEIVQRKQSLTQ